MKKLEEDYPQIEFYFIIGGDLVAGLIKWAFAEKLRKEIKFIIYERPGYKYNEKDLPTLYVKVVNKSLETTVSAT